MNSVKFTYTLNILLCIIVLGSCQAVKENSDNYTQEEIDELNRRVEIMTQ